MVIEPNLYYDNMSRNHKDELEECIKENIRVDKNRKPFLNKTT